MRIAAFFELTEQCEEGYVSSRLKEFSAYYSNRLSYAEVEGLVERMTGQHALSDQTIWQGMIAKSVDVNQQIADEAQEILQSNGNPPIIIDEQLDPYDGNTPEILLFEDGIQVRHQADERYSSKQGDRAEEKGTQRKRVNSDVIIFQQSTGDFEYLTTPIKEDGNPLLSLELLLKAKLIDEYGGGTRSNPLNIVAIVDGTRSIRYRLESLFGPSVCVILDWYHLCRKARRLMGMIAEDKDAKRLYLKKIIPWLWCGQVEKVLNYLRNQVQARSPDTLERVTHLPRKT